MKLAIETTNVIATTLKHLVVKPEDKKKLKDQEKLVEKLEEVLALKDWQKVKKDQDTKRLIILIENEKEKIKKEEDSARRKENKDVLDKIKDLLKEKIQTAKKAEE